MSRLVCDSQRGAVVLVSLVQLDISRLVEEVPDLLEVDAVIDLREAVRGALAGGQEGRRELTGCPAEEEEEPWYGLGVDRGKGVNARCVAAAGRHVQESRTSFGLRGRNISASFEEEAERVCVAILARGVEGPAAVVDWEVDVGVG